MIIIILEKAKGPDLMVKPLNWGLYRFIVSVLIQINP